MDRHRGHARNAFIKLGSPGEHGYIERVNARLCAELLNGEIFYSLRKPGVSSNPGDGTTTPYARTAVSDTGRRHRRQSFGNARTFDMDQLAGAGQADC